jgi:hypothetical protein
MSQKSRFAVLSRLNTTRLAIRYSSINPRSSLLFRRVVDIDVRLDCNKVRSESCHCEGTWACQGHVN